MVIGKNLIDMKSTGEEFKKPFLFNFFGNFFFSWGLMILICFRYVLAIAILSTLYTGFQTWKQIHEIYTSREIISRRNAAMIDFVGDQVLFS